MAADEVKAPETIEEIESVEVVEEVTEEPTEKVEQEDNEDVKVVVEEDEPKEPSELQTLRNEIADLKKIVKEDLGGKKPKEFNAEQEVSDLIKAGRATPKMKPGLLEIAATSPEAFIKLKATLPKMVNMKMESKLAKIEKESRKKEVPYLESDEYKEIAKAYGLK